MDIGQSEVTRSTPTNSQTALPHLTPPAALDQEMSNGQPRVTVSNPLTYIELDWPFTQNDVAKF